MDADQVDRAAGLADITRLLAVIKATDLAGRPLDTADLVAACHLLGSEPDHPELTFRYRFDFASGPESSDLYHDLVQLEDAGLAQHGSPITPTSAADKWLDTDGDALVRSAQHFLDGYLRSGQSLIAQSAKRERALVAAASAGPQTEATTGASIKRTA